MQKFRLLVLLVLSLSTAAFMQAAGQTQASPPPNTSDWETLRPEGEEFAVLMPKGSSFESGKEPYHKMEINARTYLSQTPGGPVLAVVSLSGIKSNPAMYSETQRVNSYVDAFKTLFTPRLKKTTPAKLHFVRNKNLMGHAGREYDFTVGDLSGKVHAFATRKRFYALVYLNNKKDDQVQEQFLSSFVLPEKIEIPPPPTAVTKSSPAPGQPGAESTPATATNQPAKEGSDNSAPGTKPDAAATAEVSGKRPIRGGVLNGKAITLPKPIHPAGVEVSGTVTIEVTIDEYGSVSSARAVSGHLQLQQAAIDAALQARFSPTYLMGEPVKVTGVITYNFVR